MERKTFVAGFLVSTLAIVGGHYSLSKIRNQIETLENIPEIRRLEKINSEFSILSNRRGTDISDYFLNPQLSSKYSKLANEKNELLTKENVRKNKDKLYYLTDAQVFPFTSLVIGTVSLFALSSIYFIDEIFKIKRKFNLPKDIATN